MVRTMYADLMKLKDQIAEELDGAKNYIKYAIEKKGSAPNWAKSFVDMSAAELGHASTLFKMFEECYHSMAKLDEKSQPYKEFLNLVYYQTTDDYMTRSAEIRYMHDMYVKS